ncbi:MAG: hypothetical protein LBV41_10655 [Cytophagaceae bacterium]|jgi:hypothetical protein|nr:hypothetical protein [Cytophagaceae bacterium]
MLREFGIRNGLKSLNFHNCTASEALPAVAIMQKSSACKGGTFSDLLVTMFCLCRQQIVMPLFLSVSYASTSSATSLHTIMKIETFGLNTSHYLSN